MNSQVIGFVILIYVELSVYRKVLPVIIHVEYNEIKSTISLRRFPGFLYHK